jgi:hypothetical protein
MNKDVLALNASGDLRWGMIVKRNTGSIPLVFFHVL